MRGPELQVTRLDHSSKYTQGDYSFNLQEWNTTLAPGDGGTTPTPRTGPQLQVHRRESWLQVHGRGPQVQHKGRDHNSRSREGRMDAVPKMGAQLLDDWRGLLVRGRGHRRGPQL